MKFRTLACSLAILAVLPMATIVSRPAPALAQGQMKDDIAQLAIDMKVGVDRSTLTAAQKEQLRDDFKELRAAHKDHRPFAAMRAARSIRTALNSGAFKPEDKERIKQDMDAIKEAREDQPGGFGGM
jgi:hypothetical protein